MERIKVNASSIGPTRISPLDPERLNRIRSAFREGKQSELPPALVVQDVDGSKFLFEGNHRIFVGDEFGEDVPAVAGGLGETISDGKMTVRINENIIARTRWMREISIRRGILTFADLKILEIR